MKKKRENTEYIWIWRHKLGFRGNRFDSIKFILKLDTQRNQHLITFPRNCNTLYIHGCWWCFFLLFFLEGIQIQNQISIFNSWTSALQLKSLIWHRTEMQKTAKTLSITFSLPNTSLVQTKKNNIKTHFHNEKKRAN